MKIENLIGRRFGRLIVVEQAANSKHRTARWKCKCDCGTIMTTNAQSLKSGRTKSCGCWKRELAGERAKTRALPHGEAAFNVLIKDMKKSAHRRDLEWNLSKEDVRFLVLQPCHYCGIPPMREFFGKKHLNGAFLCNGIDRKDHFNGYIKENCVPCCWPCNRAKGVMAYVQFKEWIKQAFNYFVKGGN